MSKYLSCAGLCAAALLLSSCISFPFMSDRSAKAEPAAEVAEPAAPEVQAKESAKAEPVAKSAAKSASSAKKGAKTSKAEPAKKSKATPSESQVRAELDKFIVSYAEHANKSMSGSRSKPKEFTRKGMHVVQYTEIDPKSVSADMRKSVSKHFDYVASMHYVEVTYECVAKDA